MQTREMKREYEVAVLDPAGNVTAIVLSDVQAGERARIAAQLRQAQQLRLPELRIEQAAFLTAPRCGGEIRLEMMGGEFCGNALRCAWLAIGNVWMFGGLLVTMKKAQRA